jgi:hypothetical protein
MMYGTATAAPAVFRKSRRVALVACCLSRAWLSCPVVACSSFIVRSFGDDFGWVVFRWAEADFAGEVFEASLRYFPGPYGNCSTAVVHPGAEAGALELEYWQVPDIRNREILNPKCRGCQIFAYILGARLKIDGKNLWRMRSTRSN